MLVIFLYTHFNIHKVDQVAPIPIVQGYSSMDIGNIRYQDGPLKRARKRKHWWSEYNWQPIF